MPYMEKQRHCQGNHDETEEDHKTSENGKLAHGRNLQS